MYSSIEDRYNKIANELVEIVKESKESIEGNVYTHHGNYNVYEYGKDKRINLYLVSKTASCILEIGFNAGHSALVFLLANNESVVYCVDICDHGYTKKCFEHLVSIFGPHRLRLYPGNSMTVVPSLVLEKSPDVYHIDGCHLHHVALADMTNCYNRAKNGDVMILDDTNIMYLQNLFDTFVKEGKLTKYNRVPLVPPRECLHEVGIVVGK